MSSVVQSQRADSRGLDLRGMLRNIPGSGQCGSVDFRDELTRDFHLLSAFRRLVIRPPGLYCPSFRLRFVPLWRRRRDYTNSVLVDCETIIQTAQPAKNHRAVISERLLKRRLHYRFS